MELEQPSQIKTDPKQYKYHAFISYRHADNKVLGRQWATWLHHAIETYEVPADLMGKKQRAVNREVDFLYRLFSRNRISRSLVFSDRIKMT
jgi:hypothetical protein